jgi:hypothetical protein
MGNIGLHDALGLLTIGKTSIPKPSLRIIASNGKKPSEPYPEGFFLISITHPIDEIDRYQEYAALIF